MKKKQSMIKSFVQPVVKTAGVCLGAYLVLCVINAYGPEKTDNKNSAPVKMKKDIIKKSEKLMMQQ